MSTPTANLVDQVGNSYILALTAAKRARQLREGAPQLIECNSNHSITIALEEIAQNKIRPVLSTEEPEPKVTVALEEDLFTLDADLALPALDEDTEAAHSTQDISDLLEDEDEETAGHDDEEEDEDEEGGEEEAAVVAEDEDTATLSSLLEGGEEEEGDEEMLEGMSLEDEEGEPDEGEEEEAEDTGSD